MRFVHKTYVLHGPWRIIVGRHIEREMGLKELHLCSSDIKEVCTSNTGIYSRRSLFVSYFGRSRLRDAQTFRWEWVAAAGCVSDLQSAG